MAQFYIRFIINKVGKMEEVKTVTVPDQVITFNYVCPSNEILLESTSVSDKVINFEILL